MLAKVKFVVSENDAKSADVKFISAQGHIPMQANPNAGPAFDPLTPEQCLVAINGNRSGRCSRHLVSAPTGHAPRPKHDDVARFFADNAITAGSKLVIQVPRAGENLIHAKL